MAKKNSFIMYNDWASLFERLPNDKAGELIKAIYNYQTGKEVEISDISLYAVFNLLKNRFDIDKANYESTCERNRQNGSKGGKQKVANAKRNVATATDRYRPLSGGDPNVADNDNDNEYDNNIIYNNIIKSEKEEKNIIPPKLEWVEEYCKERNNGINAQTFMDFYESKGWLIGKNKMKDWKAAVRNWEKNRKTDNKSDHKTTQYNFNELKRMIDG